MALLTLNFESEYLRGNTEVTVILPDKPRNRTPTQFYESGEKFKVMWLLHGTFGDHTDWIRKTNIELYACERDLVVVMPSGLNANYANWPSFSIGYNMYDYLIKELMPLIRGWLPVSDRREDNFIAGLSMGGRGTCVYALNHPELFAGAAVLSACPRDMTWSKENEPNMYKRMENAAKVNYGSMEGFLDSYENTWKILCEKVNDPALPRFYFASGTDDHLYPAFRKFREDCEKIGFKAQFEEIPGFKHEWRFWDLTVRKAMDFFGIVNKDAGNPF